MAPGIALDAINEHKRPVRVLDPMMGSGTVLAVARSCGHRAYGVDSDPLAVLLSRVWTLTVDPGEVLKKADEVLSRAKSTFSILMDREAYPRDSDDETCAFTRFWFDGYSRKQLAALSDAIRGVRDAGVRDVLWCSFSRLIITKQNGASLAMDLSHSRPHRAFERAPAKPFANFIRAVAAVVQNCPRKSCEPVGPATITKQGDARALEFADKSIDLVLTSPPYLNAIDYMRCSKFSLVWMGHRISDLRKVRKGSIGSEASSIAACSDAGVRDVVESLKLSPHPEGRNCSLLYQYVYDMRLAVAEAARVLVPGGRAVYVVGDSTVRGTYVRNSAVVAAVASLAGLRLLGRRVRSLPPNRRYLPPPSEGRSNERIDGRMRREVVLAFERTAA